MPSLNPFRSGRCLSTNRIRRGTEVEAMSQSLSIRAMSFDAPPLKVYEEMLVSIPFDQGDVFRQKYLCMI